MRDGVGKGIGIGTGAGAEGRAVGKLVNSGGCGCALDGMGGAVKGGVPVSVTRGTGIPCCWARELITMRAAIARPARTTKAAMMMAIPPVRPRASAPAVLAAALFGGGEGASGRDTMGACQACPSQYSRPFAPEGSGYQPGGLG